MAVLGEFAFADGPLRFSELEEGQGTPPNTLTERLPGWIRAFATIR